LLSISVAIIGFAIIARLRIDRRGAQGRVVARGPGRHGAPDVALLADRARGVIAWLLLVMLLTRLGVHAPGISHRRDRPIADSGTRADHHQSRAAATGFAGRPGTNVVGYLIRRC
jgi:hypothetical protein